MRLDPTVEAELVRKAQAGDGDAAQTLVMANGHLARAAACRLKRNPSDADDAEQEALFAVYLAIPKFDPARGVRFTSYAGRVVANAVLDFARRLPPRAAPIAGDVPSPQRLDGPISGATATNLLMRLLRSLPRPWRELFELLHGLNGREPHELQDACRVLGVSRKTGQRWRALAMRRLQAAFDTARGTVHA